MEPVVVEGLPFDKYELEPSKLTQKILSLKKTNVCYQVFMRHSHPSEAIGRPFGYLKAASSGTAVNLIIMPYDYPTLVPLLSDFVKVTIYLTIVTDLTEGTQAVATEVLADCL